MKRVLLVTPNWPPVTYPDMHRVRMALPYMKANGWEPLVLHTDPNEQGGYKEEILKTTIPPDTKTWQARALSRLWTSPLGLTHVGWRSLYSLYKLGIQISEAEKPDLVFFSTTMFPVMMLGPWWKKKLGIPYAIDFQDPWVPQRGSGLYQKEGLRNELSQCLDRWMERYVLAEASHVVSVSSAYCEVLRERYAHLRPEDCTFLPFGAPEKDFPIAQSQGRQSLFNKEDGWRHWVYAGRGGTDLYLSLRGFFLALAKARQEAPVTWNRVRVHFIGTHYATSRKRHRQIQAWATECGVKDLVDEKPDRIGYLESLRCLLDAEALIVPGSLDPAYSASKIYPCLLAKKPLLAIFHEDSNICSILRETKGGELVTFKTGERPQTLADRIGVQWFGRLSLPPATTDWKAFERYSAKAMTAHLCQVFNHVAERKSS